MVFRKRVSKSVALGLATVIVSGTVLNGVHASELSETNNINKILNINDISEGEVDNAKDIRDNFDNDTDFSEIFSEEQVKLFKVEFQKINGTEDTLKKVEESNDMIIESNGFRGILRYTNKKTNEVTTLNLFDSIDKLHRESMEGVTYAPARPSSWKTQGPDVANMKVVKGSSRDTITVTHPTYGGKKQYTKPTNNWYSGSTKSYYDHVQGARRSFGTAKSKAGVAGIAALTVVVDAILSAGNFHISVGEVINLLKKSGATLISTADCARYVVAYLGEVYLILNAYYKI